jgi:hypothetical protein
MRVDDSYTLERKILSRRILDVPYPLVSVRQVANRFLVYLSAHNIWEIKLDGREETERAHKKQPRPSILGWHPATTTTQPGHQVRSE